MLDDELELRLAQIEQDIEAVREEAESEGQPPDFFDFDMAHRQVIVHWLKPEEAAEGEPEPEPIVSLAKAKIEILSQARAIDLDDKRPNVSHGDILVLDSGCPFYALCAVVDAQFGEAGWQLEDDLDPPVAETDEDENTEKVFREFIVWGGCGAEPGEGGDFCVGAGGATASAIGSLSVSQAAATLTNIGFFGTAEGDPADPTTVELPSLSGLTLDSTPGDTTTFLALDPTVARCSPGDACNGIWADLKSVSSTETQKALTKEITTRTLNIVPQSLIQKTLRISNTVTTVTGDSGVLSSSVCGDLNMNSVVGSGGGGSGSIAADSISVIPTPGAEATEFSAISLDPIDPDVDIVEEGVDVFDVPGPIAVTALDTPTRVFLPVIGAFCPKTTDLTVLDSFWAAGTSAEITRACDPESDLDTQEITVTLTPRKKTLAFECGLLVGSVLEETMATATPITYKFETPCCCDEDPVDPCEPGIPSVTATFKEQDGTITTVVANFMAGQCRYAGGGMVVNFNADTGLWTASGNNAMGWSIRGSANTPNGMPTTFVGTGIAGVTAELSFS